MSIPYKEQRLPMEKVFRDPVHNYIHVQHQVILDSRYMGKPIF